MIKKVIMGFWIGLLAISCQKNTPQKENKEEQKTTSRYIASNGSNALVSFGKNEKGVNFVEINSNGKIIRVHQKTNDSLSYSEHDIIITKNNDSLQIEQGNAIIQLKKAKGQ